MASVDVFEQRLSHHTCISKDDRSTQNFWIGVNWAVIKGYHWRILPITNLFATVLGPNVKLSHPERATGHDW